MNTQDNANRDLALAHAPNGLLFASVRKVVISEMTLSWLMQRRGLEARPHGFRTSLRTWLAEATDASDEVAEACPGQVVDSRSMRAYRRTDFLDQRRSLMERWTQHLTSVISADIVPLEGQ